MEDVIEQYSRPTAMSDNILRIIPRDPSFVPSAQVQESAVSLLRRALPDADEVSAQDHGEVVFIDAGSNFESVFCPLCEEEIDLDWFSESMNVAFSTRFTELAVTTPCCAGATTLNDLRYDWPQGFAQVVLEVRNPGVATVPDELTTRVGEQLGCDVRIVWTHY